MLHKQIFNRGLLKQFFSHGKPPKKEPFDPVKYGLSSDFVMTNFTKMKG